MKILGKGIDVKFLKGLKEAETAEAVKVSNKGNKNKIQSDDKVLISERAAEISRIKKALEDSGHIRSIKIESLKKDIEKGTYNIKGELIAEKAVRESILDDVILKGKK